jgi:FixJ family two-component response regulator
MEHHPQPESRRHPARSNVGSLSSEEQGIVFIVDDDASVRAALEDLLGSIGLNVQSFGTVQEFLDSKRPDVAGCIVLDVRLPGTSGPEFQRLLAKSKISLPIIFISGHSDIAISVQAMKLGAIEFLTKPLREQELVDAVQFGIARERARRQEVRRLVGVKEGLQSLTPRERARHRRTPKQDNCCGPKVERHDGQSAPQSRHAENGCEVGDRSRQNGK